VAAATIFALVNFDPSCVKRFVRYFDIKKKKKKKKKKKTSSGNRKIDWPRYVGPEKVPRSGHNFPV